ncbi:MAG: sensor histidine kinase, partial [Pseudomonadota bacterium]
VIMNNLLSNAIRHTPPGGKITVTLTARGDRAEFAVKDSGPGIAESFRPELFEWFKTGPQAPDTPIAGSGLGLAIAQEYARHHGGTIELLESETGAHFAWRTDNEHAEAT